MKYRDAKGRTYFVDRGISHGNNHTTYATYYRKPSGSLKRVVSKNLPLRKYAALADADLFIYATKQHWEKVVDE